MHVLSLQEQSRKHSMLRHGESLPSSSSNFLQITNAKTSAVPMTPSTDPSTAATSLTNEPRDAGTGGPPAQRLDATILYTPSVASITPSLFWSSAKETTMGPSWQGIGVVLEQAMSIRVGV